MKPWESCIRQVVPYVPGEQPKGERLIKLNTNENPYPPAPGVQKLLGEMNAEHFRRYPDPGASKLLEALAACYDMHPEQVFVGVGSDDVLAMAFLTFFGSGRPVLFPDITYSFYPVWAKLFRIPYECPRLDENFRIHPQDYYRENGGIVIANPNAPTGIFLPLEQVEDILRHNQESVVIVDEAYIDFGGSSARTLLKHYENLLVVQTFSKSRSLAGLRIGYAFGSPVLIRAMQDVKYSYNSYTMNQPSIVLGAEAVKDQAYFRGTIQRIVDTREKSRKRFQELGFVCLDSSANFLFVSHERAAAAEIFQALKREQIYVRYFQAPRLDNFLRITIGTEAEMEAVCQFLASWLG